ncbi:MAG TPA: glycosyltransferase family 2 protein [Solirubrobacteraceae bacterium]|nr:glycosyltransferase family 2 protein [Solirubrobacteraceae bacterium]
MGRRLPWPASALRDRLHSLASAVGDTRAHVVAGREEARQRLEAIEARLERLEEAVAAIPPPPPAVDEARLLDAIRLAVDDEPRARAALWAARSAPEYAAAYDEEEPLVSVVIPTWLNHELLCARSLPSVLGQTYERLEVIVVGDGAPDEAREAVEAVGDPRVRFHNLPMRGPYPDDPTRRWQVSGVPPYNEGVRLAGGRWIASQDDDDVWYPDHVERLLALARERRAELVYGRLRVCGEPREKESIGTFPPRMGEFGMQGAMYHASLAPIFECEIGDGVWNEPTDWAWCRRMMRAGVRVAMLDAEVVDYYPSRGRDDSSSA